MKTCKTCGLPKELTEFYSRSKPSGGEYFFTNCKKCYSALISHRQKHDKKYLFNLRYNLMLQRTRGKNPQHKYYVEGMPLLTRQEWVVWLGKNMERFNDLYAKWEESGFKQSLSPSIDRIDNKRSYVADNMRWLTQAENAAKGNK